MFELFESAQNAAKERYKNPSKERYVPQSTNALVFFTVLHNSTSTNVGADLKLA